MLIKHLSKLNVLMFVVRVFVLEPYIALSVIALRDNIDIYRYENIAFVIAFILYAEMLNRFCVQIVQDLMCKLYVACLPELRPDEYTLVE